MKLYEMHMPDLDINVRFRILAPIESESLVLEYADEDRDRFVRAVLENVIHNLKTDVTPALRKLKKEEAKAAISSLFTGCVMLNPSLDLESWLQISNSPNLISANGVMAKGHPSAQGKAKPVKKISRVKFMNLERHLKNHVVGQDEAIEHLVKALKRSQAGLGDEGRPVGVFLFAGASGVGKTHLARELHKYLFDADSEIVRVDCGEYQHKHENQKLLGAPPGYLGHDEGGYLVNAMTENPQTVVLLDEVEKAHPDIWNTFLRVFDEGIITGSSGNTVSFRESIIIMTTNLGNGEVVNDMTLRRPGFKKFADGTELPKREQVVRLALENIQKEFRPELLNRIDKTVVFNHLTEEDYKKIAELELNTLQTKLEKRGFTLAFDNGVLGAMVRDGVSHVQGARGLAQLRRDRIEDPLADLILNERYPRGTAFRISHEADDYRVTAHRPASKKRSPNPTAPLVVAPAS